MLSDAGGGLARRRREICCLSRSFCNLSRSFFHFLTLYSSSLLSLSFHDGSMHCDNNNKGFSVKLLSLVRTVYWPATLVKEEYHLSTRPPTAKSEIYLLNISRSMDSRTFAILVVQCLSRIPSKSNLSSPCSSTEWSSALTPDSVMILTAEGLDLHQPSSPQIVSYPYVCGCTFRVIVSSSAKNLGFCLVGLSHCCGPFFLTRPTPQILNLSINYKRPRFNSFTLFPSPFIKTRCSYYALSLSSCSKTIYVIWRCEFLSQTLRLNSPMARVDETNRLKTIDELLLLKSPSRAYLVSLSGNQLFLSRHVHKATSLPVFIFINFTVKHLETESTQKGQSRDVISLFLLQTSRTVTNWSQQISSLLLRISLLHDLKGPWHPSAIVTKRTSTLPPSYMKRIRPKSLSASLWFVPTTHEAKYPFSTSQNLLIVTITKILDLFAEVSLTHHNLVCGMLLDSLCFRAFMILSPNFIAYSSYMFVVILCSKTLYPLFLPFGIE